MGEFNVNKSTGDLIDTAGMPESYPATQVMMSDGVTSVEDALDDKVVKVKTENFTTNNLGYIITFPLNVINATIDTYKTLLLCGMEGGRMYANTFYDNRVKSMGQLTANTTYSVTYTYLG